MMVFVIHSKTQLYKGKVSSLVLKEVKHPANSGSLQLAKIEIKFLNIFVLIFGLRLQRYSTNAKRYSPEKFLETLSLFSQREFPEKGKISPKLDRSCDVTGRVNTKYYYSVSIFS